VRVTVLLAWLLVAVMSSTIQAGSARMELSMAPDLVAEADYWPGAADMPAVLILHGFLQTREFPTVRRLAESLAEEGFSVLTPTLTLGIDRRRQSLDCAAIHTHTLTDDIDELDAWVRWLAGRAGKAPTVVGHSTGGSQIAAMLESETSATVDQAILIGVTTFGPESDAGGVAGQRARAEAAMAGGAADLDTYALAYCGRYVTTAAAFLSYLEWERGRLGRALAAAPVPITVIYGDRDDRVERLWLESLASDVVTVRAVSGARHFFDLAHEFDLLDEVLGVLSEVGHG